METLFQFSFFLMMFFGIGPVSGNDALDMIPTASYWQARQVTPTLEQLEQDAAADKPAGDVGKLVADLGSDDFKTRNDAKKSLEAMGPSITAQIKPLVTSKDPEVAAVASTLLKEFSEHGCARSIRRLMAIRTLGERKEKAAEPMLKAMSDSKEVFVSDYAARAVAQIEGKTYVPVDHKAEVAKDLQLLPKGTGIVAQATGMPASALMLDKVVDLAFDPANQNPMMGEMPKGMDKKKMLAKITGKALDLIERVGDVRLDGVTVGVSENVGGKGGWGIVALRGKYNRAAMIAAIKATAGEDLKLSKEDDADVIEAGSSMSIVFPSDDQILLIPADETVDKAAMIQKLLEVIKTGKGEFAENKELVALIKAVDTTGPAWAVARLTADMRKDKPFDAWSSITLTSKMDKGALKFTFTAQGDDAEKMKAAADLLKDGIQTGIAQVKQEAAVMKSMQAMVDVMESIKVAADGKTGTLTGEVKSNIADSIAAMAPLMLMESGMVEEEEIPDSQPAP